MRTGQISVQSENIFPIIKKFLYTDQEIFLRELVSNAVDATKKLSTLSRVGEFEDSIENCKVEISFDEKAKTLTISDEGLLIWLQLNLMGLNLSSHLHWVDLP